MRLSRSTAATGTVLVGLLTLLPALPAAAVVCDAYSQECLDPPAVLPTTITRPVEAPRTEVRSAVTPATLPFTGGELVLLSTAGAAAVAGGAALVVAGRRRRTDAA